MQNRLHFSGILNFLEMLEDLLVNSKSFAEGLEYETPVAIEKLFHSKQVDYSEIFQNHHCGPIYPKHCWLAWWNCCLIPYLGNHESKTAKEGTKISMMQIIARDSRSTNDVNVHFVKAPEFPEISSHAMWTLIAHFAIAASEALAEREAEPLLLALELIEFVTDEKPLETLLELLKKLKVNQSIIDFVSTFVPHRRILKEDMKRQKLQRPLVSSEKFNAATQEFPEFLDESFLLQVLAEIDKLKNFFEPVLENLKLDDQTLEAVRKKIEEVKHFLVENFLTDSKEDDFSKVLF